MALYRLKDGSVIDVEDGASPAALRAMGVAGRFGSTPASGRRETADDREVKRRADLEDRINNTGLNKFNPFAGGWANPDSASAAAIPFLDRIKSGVRAVGVTAKNLVAPKGDDRFGDAFREGGREYNVSLATEREMARRNAERNPGNDVIGMIAGALLNPVGQGLTRSAVAQITRSPQAAARVANVGNKIADKLPAIAKGVVGQSALIGAKQSGVMSLSGTEDLTDIPEALSRTGTGAGVGALAGGVLAGVTKAGMKGVQAIRDGRATGDNAERAAYDRIAQLLGPRGRKNPEAVERLIRADQARVGDPDPMLMDYSPGLTSEASIISKKPSVDASTDMVMKARERARTRGDRFETKFREAVETPDVPADAVARKAGIEAARKEAGAGLDEALDKPLTWSDELDDWVTGAGPTIRNTFKDAKGLMQDERLDPTELAFLVREEGLPVPKKGWWKTPNETNPDLRPSPAAAAETQISSEKVRMPTLRTLDYIKRAVDDKIGGMLDKGDKNAARILSKELRSLKNMLGEANPAYRAELAKQRDLFEQRDAVELGESFLKRMSNRTGAKTLLAELEKLPGDKLNDARTGMMEAIFNLRSKGADPVNAFLKYMGTAEERKVMEVLFGGKPQLRKFEAYVRREARGANSDRRVAQGNQQSITSTDLGAAADNPAENIATRAAAGFVNAGPGGGVFGAVKAIMDNARVAGTSKASREEIAKLLMSDGTGIAKGIKASEKFRKARAARLRSSTRGAGRVGGQIAAAIQGDK